MSILHYGIPTINREKRMKSQKSIVLIGFIISAQEMHEHVLMYCAGPWSDGPNNRVDRFPKIWTPLTTFYRMVLVADIFFVDKFA